MWALAIVLIVITISFTISVMTVYFAEEITEFLKAKAEELRVKTEILRKEKSSNEN